MNFKRLKVHKKLVWGLVLILSLSVVCSMGQASKHPSQKFKKEKIKHNPKIETKLKLIASSLESEDFPLAKFIARSAGTKLINWESIEVILEEKKGASVSPSSIRKAGGEIFDRTEELVKVKIPANRMEELAESTPAVRYIRSPHSPVTFEEGGNNAQGPYNSAGVNLTGASLYHVNNYLGQGVKVAVIDVGFASYNLAKEAGQLPPDVVAETRDYTGTGFLSGSAHGTGVAEIVHDMAPSAKLYLKKIGDEVGLATAVDQAISQDVDIIVHSVGWLNTNFGDGTGVIANIAKEATRRGVLWVNAAGNFARRHWEGTISNEDENAWVEFENGKEFISLEVDAGYEIYSTLTWNDWPKTDIDLDLYLYDSSWNLLASSQNYQTGNEPPSELLRYSYPDPGKYHLKISGPEDLNRLEVEIFSLNHQLENPVKRSSIMAPANAEEVFTVGAIAESHWKEGQIEPFSSRGPTWDGRVKPDIAGIDGVTTYIYRKFLGTSASTPNMAGAAALLLSREPNLAVDQLKAALGQHAEDLGKRGEDNTYGKGKIRLLFDSPTATRKINEGSNVSPGEDFIVDLVANMPLTLQGGIKIEERLPEPFELSEVIKPDSYSETDGGRIKFDWPVVSPGSSRKATYKIHVPEDAEPGNYEIEGEINGEEVDSTEITVGPTGTSSKKNYSVVELEKVITRTDSTSIFNGVKFETLGSNISQVRVTVYNFNGQQV
ncbi:S8 family serine peptidase, partial [Candidatus Bipolaricaulota bacterium]|nr:S8 family serine peptidase [Candidatus Bipolaricaulota bacterium]